MRVRTSMWAARCVAAMAIGLSGGSAHAVCGHDVPSVVPVVSPPISDAVAVRWKVRVNANFQQVHRKILFASTALAPNTANGGRYAIEANLTNDRTIYSGDLGCPPWPPQSNGTVVTSQAPLWISMMDQPSICPVTNEFCPVSNVCQPSGLACARGRFGIRPDNLSAFPLMNAGLDNIPGSSKIDLWSQFSLNDQTVEISMVRGSLMSVSTPETGWGHRVDRDGQGNIICNAYLPTGTYRVWDVTATVGSTPYTFEMAMPSANGAYLQAGSLLNFTPEFLHLEGFFQVYVWDIAIQRENDPDWEPLTDLKLEGPRLDGPLGPNEHYGIRLAQFDGHPVVEISNDGTDTYFQCGGSYETFTIPSTVGGLPQDLPAIRWTTAAQSVKENRVVTVQAELSEPAPAAFQMPVVVGGTATNPSDHDLGANPTLSFAQNATTASIQFTVANTVAVENPETVTLRFATPLPPATPNAAKIGEVVQHVVTILAQCGDGVVDTGEQCDTSGATACCTADCQAVAVGTSCSDGNACTSPDTCDGAGACTAGSAVTCNDGNQCTNDSCNTSTGCVYTPHTGTCDDGDVCTAASACLGGACLPLLPANCDDANPQTKDSCSPGTGCQHVANQWQSLCGNGVVDTGAGEQCDDGNTRDRDCCASDCRFEPGFSPCYDGNLCTYPDVCNGQGACANAGCSGRTGLACGSVCGQSTVCTSGCACQ